jgi:MFS family permease
MVEVAVPAHAAPAPDAAGPLEIPEFEIVPRKGLVIVGVLLGLLVAAIAVNKLWPLEFLHVASGAAWTIIDLFLGLVLGPIMGRMTVPARVEFTTKLMPKMLLIMPTVVTLTLAAGWQLANKLGTVLSSYPNHGWVVASFIVVGVMSVIALGLLEPANIAVLVELKKRRPNPEVIDRLMKRFVYSALVLGVMQISTLVIMTKLRTG